MLLSCGKASNTIDGDMVTNVVQHVASVISQETDTSYDSYLTSLLKCATGRTAGRNSRILVKRQVEGIQKREYMVEAGEGAKMSMRVGHRHVTCGT